MPAVSQIVTSIDPMNATRCRNRRNTSATRMTDHRRARIMWGEPSASSRRASAVAPRERIDTMCSMSQRSMRSIPSPRPTSPMSSHITTTARPRNIQRRPPGPRS
jgi:hypothetical protein